MAFKRPVRSRVNKAPSSTRGRHNHPSRFSHPRSSQPSPSQPRSSQTSTPNRPRQDQRSDRFNEAGPGSSAAASSTIGDLGDPREEQNNDDDSLNEVVMAVELRDRNTVGCCYYVAREGKLYLMNDMKMGSVEIVDQLKLSIEPTVVLISTRVDEEMEARLNPEAADSDESVLDRFGLPYLLQIRPSSEFNYEAAKSKLISINFNAEPPEIAFITPGDNVHSLDHDDVGEESGVRQGKFLRLSGLIDLESRISSESHPHSHNQGPSRTSGAKEGLSVYGLFHHLARTPQGRARLRQYFLRPSLDLTLINERLDTISIFTLPDNESLSQTLVNSLKYVKNIRPVMIQLRKGLKGGSTAGAGIKNGVWRILRDFTFHALRIRDGLSKVIRVERLPIAANVFQAFDRRAINRVGQIISDVVDFEASIEQHRTVVKRGVDEKLDEIKHTYDGIEGILTSVVRSLAQALPDDVSVPLNVVFFPQLGFLITVPLDPESGKAMYAGGMNGQEPWEKMFTSELQAYYKNDNMLEMDAHFGDIFLLRADREIEIIYELAQSVLEYEDLLNTASDLCGELDSLLALAQGAKLHKLSRPQMTQDNIIRIKSGRHLLQELTVPTYVPNDTLLVGGPGEPDSLQEGLESRRPSQRSRGDSHESNIDDPSVLIMTGPNYSGKSVYLKQVALIVYLAHIGSFVPAESAEIGLTDKILTRIATRETISKVQSAFMIDLQQVAFALSMATRRSLVIIDEFGTRTDANDGAGLACGVFEHLLGLGVEGPKVLGATHFHGQKPKIFENGFLQPRSHLQFGHMEVQVDVEAEQLENQIVYLYKYSFPIYAEYMSDHSKASDSVVAEPALVLGERAPHPFRALRPPFRPVAHLLVSCAALNGVDPVVVNRAEQLILLSAQGEDLVAACSSLAPTEAAELKEAEIIARRFLEKDILDPDLTVADDGQGGGGGEDPRELLLDVLERMPAAG
ncbi:MAG: hypothetical protein M1819_000009 [Sarea resinae]|nr:MAG: hypothetical protein M1819_000009 [Sarea resinae]